MHAISQSESFLIAMLIIFGAPFLIWRYLKTDYFMPIVVVQIVIGVIFGPSLLGSYFTDANRAVFSRETLQGLNGISSWAVLIFVFVSGIELDLKDALQNKLDNGITVALALSVPLLLGVIVGTSLLSYSGWIGVGVHHWQFVLSIGMCTSITALPVLIIFLDKLGLLRQSIGQRVLRYASIDDILIWVVLAIVLMDVGHFENQLIFFAGLSIASILYRKAMSAISEADRWCYAIIWAIVVALASERVGLHFMAGAFIAGAITDSRWFDQKTLDFLRLQVLLILMPVYFFCTGLKVTWSTGGWSVIIVAVILLFATVVGKLIATHLAGKILKWKTGESSIIGWLLQSKSLMTIIFTNILLDRGIITGNMFSALLIMSAISTVLTMPIVSRKLAIADNVAKMASLSADQVAPNII